LGALAEALETVSHDRLTRLLRSDWSGQRLLELAFRTLFVWERGYLIIDDTVIPKPFAVAIEGLAWVFSSLERKPVYGLSLVLLVWTNGTLRYRALDRDGNLIDARLSDTRDLAAAEAFFRSAWTVTGVTPDRITTDGHDAYPRAIRNVFGDGVTHRTNRYFNNHLEQDHRGIKQRYRPMGGFKHGHSAAHFCRLFDESVPCSAPSHGVISLSHSRSAGASIRTASPS
jgi:DDE domain